MWSRYLWRIPGIPFLVGFWIDDDSRRHACRAGFCKLVDLALRSAHLARLHFGVLFDNNVFREVSCELACTVTIDWLNAS